MGGHCQVAGDTTVLVRYLMPDARCQAWRLSDVIDATYYLIITTNALKKKKVEYHIICLQNLQHNFGTKSLLLRTKTSERY